MNQNALVASSDADEMMRILQNRIEIYKSPKAGKGLSDLTQIRLQYEQYLAEAKFNRYTPSDVRQLIQELYTLPMNGINLKDAMDVEEGARRSIAEVQNKAKPVIYLASFCEKFISKVKPAASWLYRRFEKRHT